MPLIDSESSLKATILQLEQKRADDLIALKAYFHLAYDSIKPINIIKNTFRAAVESHQLKSDIVDTSIGMATGYLSKKMFEGFSTNPVKKLFGTFIMVGISNVVTKHPEIIKVLGIALLKTLRGSHTRRTQELTETEYSTSRETQGSGA